MVKHVKTVIPPRELEKLFEADDRVLLESEYAGVLERFSKEPSARWAPRHKLIVVHALKKGLFKPEDYKTLHLTFAELGEWVRAYDRARTVRLEFGIAGLTVTRSQQIRRKAERMFPAEIAASRFSTLKPD